MNIVVLDGYTLNPGDLNWQGFTDLGNCTVYDRTPPEKIVARAQHAQCVLTNKVILSQEILQQLPKLQYIGVLATGYNVVDIEQASKQGIIVTNVPGYATESVVQAVLAFLLEMTNHVGDYNRKVHEGVWSKSLDFCFLDKPLIELSNRTLGIIGFGSIGKRVGQIAQAFNMKILVNTRTPQTSMQASFVDLKTLFTSSDVITLHCPLTPQTSGLINKSSLSLMKDSAFLINTGRGGLIHEQDLADALNQEKIAGAGLDVLTIEPPPISNPLLTAKNCIITPHIAWSSQSARKQLIEVAVANVRGFLQGKPVNKVV